MTHTSDKHFTDEELELVAHGKADGIYMKAPNGSPTSLNERQWVQVRTKAFKNWFGDWENAPETASRIVDDNGEPLVVHHGIAVGRCRGGECHSHCFSVKRVISGRAPNRIG